MGMVLVGMGCPDPSEEEQGSQTFMRTAHWGLCKGAG